MESDDSNRSSDFRDRLSRIPNVDERPSDDLWETVAPPVVRVPAPIARPAAVGPGPRLNAGRVAEVATPSFHGEHVDRAPELDPEIDDFEPIGNRGRRRRWPLVSFTLFALLAVAILVPLFMARRVFNSVERVQVAQVLTPSLPEGTNILLVGTDSRAGIDASTANAGAIIGAAEAITGERTDTIMILRLHEDGTSKFLSLPRDLWLPINGGAPQRINTAFRQGPEAIINTVQGELGVPISHYVQVDLAGFIDLVDAVGGVDITIPYPAFDQESGLNLPTAGRVTLDSTQALAYVRSRFFYELRDGVRVTDPTSDLGRVQRQQEFMRALMAKLSTQRDPRVLNDMGAAMASAIAMDDATSLTQALGIVNSLRGAAPESVVLPTFPDSIGGNSVLLLTPEAPEILAQFGG
ncbi:MAG: LCP family protein required for cell wall assembly [Verrucomicrobiales bacterium]